MDRLKQIRNECIKTFFDANGRMPTSKELDKLINQKGVYKPVTVPMVPLHGAKSNSDYIRKDLLDLIKDRNLIDDLATSLSDRIDRVELASISEANKIIQRAESLLTDTQDNTFSKVSVSYTHLRAHET